MPFPLAFALLLGPTWTSYKGDGFTVDLPTKPQIQSQTFSAEGVSGKTKNAIAPTPAFACVASTTVFSKSIPAAVMTNIVGGIKTGFLNSVGGVATADKKATYAGRTGRLIDFNTGKGQPGKLWIVKTSSQKVVVLTILGQKGFPTAEAKRFFGSFRVK